MSRLTKREELLEFLSLCGLNEVFFGSDGALQDIFGYMSLVTTYRYLEERKPVPKSVHWLETVLPNLDDRRFRGFIRMDKQTFADLLPIIEG